MNNYFNFDISKEASVFTPAFYIVGYSNYLKKLMRDDPNVLPNYSSLPVYVKNLDMVNNKLELKYPAFYITVDCDIINREEDENAQAGQKQSKVEHLLEAQNKKNKLKQQNT